MNGWDFIGTKADGKDDRVTFSFCKISGGPLDGSVHEMPEPMSFKRGRSVYMVCNNEAYDVVSVVSDVAFLKHLSPEEIENMARQCPRT